MKGEVFVLGLMVLLAGGCGDEDKNPCPGGTQLCDRACLDINDDAHCGECFNACDAENGYTCNAGECTCGSKSECDGNCVEKQGRGWTNCFRCYPRFHATRFGG